LRAPFPRAGITDRRKLRVKLAIAAFPKGGDSMMPREALTEKEIQVPSLAWQGLIPPRKLVGTTQLVIRDHRRSTFDKLGVWSRLELTRYIASHAGQGWRQAHRRHGSAVLFQHCGPFPRDKCCKRFAFDLRFTRELTSNSLIKSQLQKLSFGL
jgi:hypothetical protein